MSKLHRTIIVILSSAIALVAFMRVHLAITRAFDPDEFAYLHWTWLVFHGYQPYRDFFFYIMPGLQWILSPLLRATGDSTNFLIASRVFLFVIYGSCAVLVYQLTKHHTQWERAPTSGVGLPLLATTIFLTFPVTLDKTIDIRPDMVMLLLYFASTVLLLQPERVSPFQAKFIVSGALFGMSFLMLPKIIFGLPAIVYLLVTHQNPTNLITHKRLNLLGAKLWAAGAALVGLAFLGYLSANNLVPQAITGITKDSLAVTSGKLSFSPLFLLTPYPLIYVTQGGPSLPWAVNTAVWTLGIVGLAFLWKDHRRMAIFWSLFIAGNILFVVLFPAPYVQYFLPLSVAGSILAGHALSVIPGLTRNPVPILRWIPAPRSKSGTSFAGMINPIISVFLPVLLLSSFLLQYRERVAPGADNREQLQVIRNVLAISKPTDTFYDMVGSYVFRPDGYYICCHPYGEFVQRLASRPGLEASLRESLVKRQTKFLVMDRVGFVFWQTPTPDLSFLRSNYLPTPYNKIYSLGIAFHCQNGACMQPGATRSTNFFTILVPEKYMITIEPNTASATVDGKEMRNGQTFDLTAGLHRFSVSPPATLLRVQLDR